jgi:hypothetical protein
MSSIPYSRGVGATPPFTGRGNHPLTKLRWPHAQATPQFGVVMRVSPSVRSGYLTYPYIEKYV